MRNLVCCSAMVALGVMCTLGSVQAGSPWDLDNPSWNLNSAGGAFAPRTARLQEDPPPPPAAEADALPSPSDAEAAQPQPVTPIDAEDTDDAPAVGSGTYHNYAGDYASNAGSVPGIDNFCSSCESSNCGHGHLFSNWFSGLHAQCGLLCGKVCGLGCGSSCDQNCDLGCGSGCGNGCWYGGVYGLVMDRNDDDNTWLSYDSAVGLSPLLSTGSARGDTAGGVETRIGYFFNACTAIEATYWGIYPQQEEAWACGTCAGGDLSSVLSFNGLVYDNGTVSDAVVNWFGQPGDGAQAHRLRRDYDVTNIEINFLRIPCGGCNPCTTFQLLAGVRYLGFDDAMSFASDYTNVAFGDDTFNELDYDIDVENHLLGLQIGGRVEHYLWGALSAHAGTKLGVYNNHMRHRQFIYGGNGFATIDGTGEAYNTFDSSNDVAFLGEFFAGLSYDLGSHWRLTSGYRALAVNGVALSTSQIAQDWEFTDLQRAAQIDSNDSLILHGGYMGVEFAW